MSEDMKGVHACTDAERKAALEAASNEKSMLRDSLEDTAIRSLPFGEALSNARNANSMLNGQSRRGTDALLVKDCDEHGKPLNTPKKEEGFFKSMFGF